jgi:ABC-type branched-subunit amino acid transport system permease subunit
MKIFAGVVAAGLLAAYLGPVIIKLKDVPLAIVVLIGFGLMATDLWQTLTSKDD